MVEWSKTIDCKSIRILSFVGSNPTFFIMKTFFINENKLVNYFLILINMIEID
jgi:hypothetical protein